jgi:mannose-6-phosphate isomerase-like protein (cupin superfamily)
MQKRQTIGNNASGEALTMLVSEDENGGACQLYEVHLPPYRPTPPLHYHVDFTETFTVKTGQLDIYIGTEQRRLLLCAGDSVTAKLRQPHRFANDHDEAVTFTVETKPAAGVVKAFQMAYGIANDGGAAPDGLPKNPIAGLVFVKTAQGYLPGIPLTLQTLVFACAQFVVKITGLEKKWQVYFS